jgi:hypothetical protein
MQAGARDEQTAAGGELCGSPRLAGVWEYPFCGKDDLKQTRLTNGDRVTVRGWRAALSAAHPRNPA